MRRALVGVLVVAVVVVAVGRGDAAEPARTYVRIPVSDRAALDELARTVELDERTRADVAYAWLKPGEREKLEARGFVVEEAIEPRAAARALTMCSDPDGPPYEPPFAWSCYPTWSQYVDMMEWYAATYPELCRLVDLGPSGTGAHDLLALVISDNVHLEEDEPEFLYTSSMHGDELTGYVLLLRLADSLLTGYGSDPELTALVDGLEIWINPLANPDGTFLGGDSTVSGAQRYNAAGYDINRSFPQGPGDDPTTGGWIPEVQRMVDLAAVQSFVMAANFHGGAEVVNYPWDYTYTLHVDDAWFQTVSHEYADNAQEASPEEPYYFDRRDSNDVPYFDDGITNGAAWYVIDGGRQDFMNYYHGCREVTIEISDTKLIDSSQLDAHWTWNRQALLDYMKRSLTGIRGVVSDAVSGDPVAATVKVVGHDLASQQSWVYSDPDVGNYHRPIDGGTWDLELSAWGYQTQQVSDVVLPDTADAVITSPQLAPIPASRALSGAVRESGSSTPVLGATVNLDNASAPVLKSDESGVYRFAAVPDGVYDLEVVAWGYQSVTVPGITLSSGTGDVVQDVTLSRAPTAGTLDGSVTEQGSSAPVDGATVALVGAPVPFRVTGLDGSFEVDPVEAGTWTFGVTAPGYHPTIVRGVAVSAGSTQSVPVALRPIVWVDLQGVIADAVSGLPIDGASVEVLGPTIATTSTGADGHFQMLDLIDGTYLVTVSAAGYRTYEVERQLAEPLVTMNAALEPINALMAMDFEATDGGLVSSSPSGWQWGTDAVAGAHSGSKVWGTVLGDGEDDGDYQNSVLWTLDAPAVAVPSDSTSATLVFWHWYDTESTWDGGQVQVSIDGGAYAVVTPVGGYPDSDVDGIGNNQPGWSGLSGGWREVRIDLAAAIGHSVAVRFRFGSDGSQVDRGWYLDDLRLETTGGAPTPLFADGFESGGLGAWSDTVGD